MVFRKTVLALIFCLAAFAFSGCNSMSSMYQTPQDRAAGRLGWDIGQALGGGTYIPPPFWGQREKQAWSRTSRGLTPWQPPTLDPRPKRRLDRGIKSFYRQNERRRSQEIVTKGERRNWWHSLWENGSITFQRGTWLFSKKFFFESKTRKRTNNLQTPLSLITNTFLWKK